MLIQDSDMPAIWYHRVKKAWAESVENGTAFANPVQERDAALAELTAATGPKCGMRSTYRRLRGLRRSPRRR